MPDGGLGGFSKFSLAKIKEMEEPVLLSAEFYVELGSKTAGHGQGMTPLSRCLPRVSMILYACAGGGTIPDEADYITYVVRIIQERSQHFEVCRSCVQSDAALIGGEVEGRASHQD